MRTKKGAIIDEGASMKKKKNRRERRDRKHNQRGGGKKEEKNAGEEVIGVDHCRRRGGVGRRRGIGSTERKTALTTLSKRGVSGLRYRKAREEIPGDGVIFQGKVNAVKKKRVNKGNEHHIPSTEISERGEKKVSKMHSTPISKKGGRKRRSTREVGEKGKGYLFSSFVRRTFVTEEEGWSGPLRIRPNREGVFFEKKRTQFYESSSDMCQGKIALEKPGQL